MESARGKTITVLLEVGRTTAWQELVYKTKPPKFTSVVRDPLVGHAVIASDYRAGAPWFVSRCGQSLY